jgi:phytoene dehydrogenase-like protein
MGEDGKAYKRLLQPFVDHDQRLLADILKPLHFPENPFLMARFTFYALRSLRDLAGSHFKSDRTKALFAGLAAHAMIPLEHTATAAFGIVLATLAHTRGWPLIRGGSLEEIAASIRDVSAGKESPSPYVIIAQQSLFDPSRAPSGKHTAWAYCHIPHGYTTDVSGLIESKIERYAPGFREVIMARNTLTAAAMEQYNANYVGGDINGGLQDLSQLFSRPIVSLNPYRTSAKNIYLCSSSTPPVEVFTVFAAIMRHNPSVNES